MIGLFCWMLRGVELLGIRRHGILWWSEKSDDVVHNRDGWFVVCCVFCSQKCAGASGLVGLMCRAKQLETRHHVPERVWGSILFAFWR